MSRVVDLRPRIQDPPDQCDVTAEEMQLPYNVANSDYRKRVARRSGKDLQRCMKSSKYIVDGRHLCGLHAGLAALRILIEE